MRGLDGNKVESDSIAYVDFIHGVTMAYKFEYYRKHKLVIDQALNAGELTRMLTGHPLERRKKYNFSGVFYKVQGKASDKESDKWIDVRSAQKSTPVKTYINETLGLTYYGIKDVANAAYALGLFKVYPGRYIPAGEYTDIDGHITNFGVNEGVDDPDVIEERHLVYTHNRFTGEFFANNGDGTGDVMNESNGGVAIDYRLRFGYPLVTDRNNILVIINGMFIGGGDTFMLRKPSRTPDIAYIEGLRNNIEVEKLFYNDLLPDDHEDQDHTPYYMIRPNIMRWKDILIKDPILAQEIIPIQTVKTSVDTDQDGIGDTEVEAIASFDLVFQREFKSYMLFYKNQWIYSERSAAHPGARLRINVGVPQDVEDLDFTSDHDKFWLVEFDTPTPDKEDIILDQMEGIPNYHGVKNVVRFPRAITNALITYNGLNLQYKLLDPYTIEYSPNRFSIDRRLEDGYYDGGVEDDAQIVAHTVNVRKK
jgi:hypothetical protein